MFVYFNQVQIILCAINFLEPVAKATHRLSIRGKFVLFPFLGQLLNQRTNGPVNAHLISWPSKAQNIHNLENIW